MRARSIGLALLMGSTAAPAPAQRDAEATLVLRLSVRDVAVSFDRLTGPADRLARAATASRFTTHLVFSFGLDIALDAKRGRRY